MNMLWLGFGLMVTGLAMGLVAVNKASKQTISPVKLGWMCYGGLFIALVGTIFIGQVW